MAMAKSLHTRKREVREMARAGKKEVKSKRVAFSLEAPQVERVSVAGDFNHWNPAAHPLKRDKKGVWKIWLYLPPGTYEYRFWVDGEWQNDPKCADCVANPYGTFNCVRKVE